MLSSPTRGFPLERIAGTTSSMSYWADVFSRVAVHLRELRGAVSSATALPGVGSSITAARDDAVRLRGAMASEIAEAQLLTRVLQRYAAAHDEHAQRANAMIGELEEAHARWQALGRAADGAGRAAMAASWGDDRARIEDAEEEARDAIRVRDLAEGELDELWRAYEHHYGGWDEAYDEAVRALVPTEGIALTLEARSLLDDLLSADSPAQVLALWAAHPELQRELLHAHPTILGRMDGLPAMDRVAANRIAAPLWISEAQAELADVSADSERAGFLRDEIAYLEQVLSDENPVQLYLYDRDRSRIVEMLGEPSPETERVITYVPGTFTSLRSLYTGGVQQVPGEMVRGVPGTVAFVYKDGLFPGEDTDAGGVNLLRITEANDEDRARGAGVQLGRFEEGMRTDPLLGGVEQDVFGHSWGLANATSSEVAGAEYDKVVSLSGAGMLPEWTPEPGTTYADLSYNDILQTAQDMGLVWNGNTPREHPAFEHGDYYRGPEDEVLDSASAGSINGHPSVYIPSDYFSVLMENHDLIATDSDDNLRAREDMKWLVSH